MKLSTLLEGVPVSKRYEAFFDKQNAIRDPEIRGVQYDSRKVRPGELFVAIRGAALDGHRFIQDAVQNGATAVLVEDDGAADDSYVHRADVAKMVVPDTRRALALVSGNFYGHPSQKLRLIGVTGTNGKTTTTFLVKSILEAHGEKVGLIGTVHYMVGEGVSPAVHTTPESLELNQLLTAMVDRGCTAVVMEVSSHALALRRVYGLRYAAAVFTNLTQDHLDFHGSMEEYFKAKKVLFDSLLGDAVAVTNSDDVYGEKIVGDTPARKLLYGMGEHAQVRAQDVRMDVSGLGFSIMDGGAKQYVRSSLTGMFNVANITAAYAVTRAIGVAAATAVSGIEQVDLVPGRFQQVASPAGWTAIVDYAHTPDALENCLKAIHDILAGSRTRGRVITVFGCGGNRDRGKRPIMGRIASRLSDVTIITSDNPRGESPEGIIKEIKKGVDPGADVQMEVDRRVAIRKALAMARPGDVVLIAGKGHESYQVVGSVKTHFDDREEIETFIRDNQ